MAVLQLLQNLRRCGISSTLKGKGSPASDSCFKQARVAESCPCPAGHMALPRGGHTRQMLGPWSVVELGRASLDGRNTYLFWVRGGRQPPWPVLSYGRPPLPQHKKPVSLPVSCTLLRRLDLDFRPCIGTLGGGQGPSSFLVLNREQTEHSR